MWLTSFVARHFAKRLTSHRVQQRSALKRTKKFVFESLEERRVLDGDDAFALTGGDLGCLWVTGPSETLHESSGNAVFTIGGGSGNEEPVTVEYRAIAGSATPSDDFEAVTGILTFAAGSSAQQVTVPIVDDLLAEDDETFYLELFNAVNSFIAVSQAQATLSINDHAPVLQAIEDLDMDEEMELAFSVVADDPDSPQETLTYSLEAGAPSGASIDSQTGQFTWTPHEPDGPGVFEMTVRVTDSGSPSLSSTETFTVTVNEVNAAPTTTGLGNVTVNEDADDTVVELLPGFDDAEDTASGLSYSVVENSNSALFASVSIDSAGRLHLDYAANAFGTATLTIRGIDTGGLCVETNMNVEVLAVDDAPVLSGFDVRFGQSAWCITGSVSDVDDDVTGWTVSFGGILAGYGLSATVNSDGSFELIDELPGLASGRATAWTFDSTSVQSNVADCSV